MAKSAVAKAATRRRIQWHWGPNRRCLPDLGKAVKSYVLEATEAFETCTRAAQFRMNPAGDNDVAIRTLQRLCANFTFLPTDTVRHGGDQCASWYWNRTELVPVSREDLTGIVAAWAEDRMLQGSGPAASRDILQRFGRLTAA